MKKVFILNVFLFFIFFLFATEINAKKIPNLIGKWEGENIKSSLKSGFSRSQNIVVITEQKNRVFKGHVIHKGGKEDFVGVIRHDHKNFLWADSSDDDGKVIGKILKKNRIETCYLDSGKDAIAGCSILNRED